MPNKHQLKPTTLDDLAAMINQGFTETQKHLDKRWTVWISIGHDGSAI
jgi:hypothetical protein